MCYAQQGPDYVIMRNSGDTIYCDIMEEKIFYRPQKTEFVLSPRRKIIDYNGFHGIIARVGKDSILFLESGQILGYYQHNSLIFENKRMLGITYNPRPMGYYSSFDLGKKANYVKVASFFRYVLACEANEEMLGYKLKYNEPYHLYTCYLSDSEGYWIDAYILKKDTAIYFLGRWVHLRQAGKKLGIAPKLWRKGGRNFREAVLRFQFALNQLQYKQ